MSDSDQPALNIKLVDNDCTLHFRIKPTTSFRRIKAAFARRVGKTVDTICLDYDGQRVSDSETPSTYCIEDDDTLIVYYVTPKKTAGSNNKTTVSSSKATATSVKSGKATSKRKRVTIESDDSDDDVRAIEADGESDEPAVQVKLETADGKQTDYKLKMTTDHWGSIKSAFSRKVGKPSETIFFVYNGRKVDDDATPYDVDFKPGHAVLAVIASKKKKIT